MRSLFMMPFQVMDRRNSHRMDEESMALCAKLLELNPEVCTGTFESCKTVVHTARQ